MPVAIVVVLFLVRRKLWPPVLELDFLPEDAARKRGDKEKLEWLARRNAHLTEKERADREIHNSLQHREVYQYLGFLYVDYEDKYYYWEACVLLRKVTSIVLDVYMQQSSIFIRLNVLWGLIISVLVLHLIFEPYKADLIDRIEKYELVITVRPWVRRFVVHHEEPQKYSLTRHLEEVLTISITHRTYCSE
eukprot:856452-Pyramimonas_sp.AAC.1